MAKAKAKSPSAADVETASREAVVRLLQSPGKLKLSGRGESLFPSASGLNGAAIQRCIDGDPPWLVTRKDGRSEIVAATPAGFLAAAPDLDPDRIGELAAALAPDVAPASARLVFLDKVVALAPTAVVELASIQEAAIADEQRERDAELAAAEKRRTTEQAAVAAMEHWKAGMDARKRDRIAGLKRALASEGVTADDGPGPDPKPDRVLPPIDPKTDADYVFRRDVARQLASTWMKASQADKADVRDYLESAMVNVRGLDMIGEPDGTAAFDGRVHEGGEGLFTDDEVRIVRPGWVLSEGDDATHVVLKAAVVPAG